MSDERTHLLPDQLRLVPLDEEGKIILAHIDDELERRLPPLLRDAVAKEEEIRYRQFKWFVAVVALIGLGTFGTLANYLIQQAVEARIEGRTNRITDAVEFARYYTISLKLDLGSSFSQSDVEAILAYLRKAAKNEAVRHTPEFEAALLQVTKALSEAGQAAPIDEIVSMYEREILASPPIVQALLHHYGQDLTGRNAVPGDDTSLKTFERLERVSGSSRVPELALYYRTLFAYSTAAKHPSATVSELLEAAADLTTADKERYLIEMLTRTKADNWVRQRDPKAQRLERVTRQFLRDYSEALGKTWRADASVFMQAASQGVGSDRVEVLAKGIINERNE